jgi:type II secretory pathway pseudopilin PulG
VKTARRAAGFSVVEVLVAALVLGVGLAALAQSLRAAVAGIETGRGESIAVFVAEQRIERLRAEARADWAGPALRPGLHGEDEATVGAGPSLRRETFIVDDPGEPCRSPCKLVRVTVTRRRPGEGDAPGQRGVTLWALFVPRR